ncbi:MAG: hypothetical protein M3Z24_14345 [Chloroflexota bacterium]|nr:hypothetical protein [Chloroflexota bacterium]
MSMNGINAQTVRSTTHSRPIGRIILSIGIRVLIALILSWAIFMLFFVSGVISR